MPLQNIIKSSKAVIIWILSLMTIHLANAQDTNELVEDRFAISELVADYAYRWDRKDAVSFSKLFAPNASIDWVIGGKKVEQQVVGRDSIVLYARKAFAERIGEKRSRHHFSNLVFKELSSDKSTTEHMVLVTHLSPGETAELVTTGYYTIEWEKMDSQWNIAKRTLYVDR